MDRRKGFTLIELLVVIAIIALLLSILMPALGRVKEQGRSIVCRSFFKSISISNHMYSAEYDERFVPLDGGPGGHGCWESNPVFYEHLEVRGKPLYGEAFRNAVICPSAGEGIYAVTVTGKKEYAFTIGCNINGVKGRPVNGGKVNGGFGNGFSYYGVRSTELKSPGSKMMYMEVTGGMNSVRYGLAPYEENWDIYGDMLGGDVWVIASIPYWWTPAYRHSDGSNILFFDGHLDILKKQEIYDYDNPQRTRKRLWDIGQR